MADEEKKAYWEGERRYTKYNDEKTITTNNWITILPIYQTCMDHEQMVRITYQNLLATLEVGLFGLFFTLYELQLTNRLKFAHPWILSIAGIFLCVSLGISCEFRARNVDIWRKLIVKLVGGKGVEDAFKKGKYQWIPFGKSGVLGQSLVGHWFERVLIPLMLFVWVFILWYFPFLLPCFVSLSIRLFFTFLVFLYMLYTFELIERLIESKVGYYGYE